MEFKNLEVFKAWIEDTIHPKYANYDFDAFLNDLATQHGNSGMAIYEMPSHKTKSGCPEEFKYKVEISEEDEYDNIPMTFIF